MNDGIMRMGHQSLRVQLDSLNNRVSLLNYQVANWPGKIYIQFQATYNLSNYTNIIKCIGIVASSANVSQQRDFNYG